MHELGICDALLKMLRNVAEEEKLENVQSITVEVGTLSGVVPRFLSDCWQAVIDGTEFAAVDMIVETVEGEAQCIECGERFVADLITVFFQGSLCISLETSAGFYISPLPLRYENATISKHGELYFVEGKNALCIFNARGKKLFDEEVLSYTADEATLKASVKLSGGAKRVLYGEWALAQNECYRISGKIEGTENSGLIAYDFFENFRVGADVSAFLSRELTEKSEKLGAYFGEYAYAFPCENENECGVLRKKGERIYEADYYVTETSGGKITDFKKI